MASFIHLFIIRHNCQRIQNAKQTFNSFRNKIKLVGIRVFSAVHLTSVFTRQTGTDPGLMIPQYSISTMCPWIFIMFFFFFSFQLKSFQFSQRFCFVDKSTTAFLPLFTLFIFFQDDVQPVERCYYCSRCHFFSVELFPGLSTLCLRLQHMTSEGHV